MAGMFPLTNEYASLIIQGLERTADVNQFLAIFVDSLFPVTCSKSRLSYSSPAVLS